MEISKRSNEVQRYVTALKAENLRLQRQIYKLKAEKVSLENEIKILKEKGGEIKLVVKPTIYKKNQYSVVKERGGVK
ncbi:MAG: hypothetical protein ABSH06_28905 [Thermodesulfobacteriota bacterium]|jgi:SMC interacting uncharacterized protein involved in chromosome segregation